MLVHTPSYTFGILNGLTVIFAYAKLEGDLFFFDWKMTLAPTILYLIILTLRYLHKVVFMDEKVYKESFSLKLNRFQLLDHFFHFIMTLNMLFFVGYAAYFLDVEEVKVPTKPLYIAIALYLIIQIVYSAVSRSIENDNLLPMTNKEKDSSIFTAIMSPILNFLGSSFVLCSGGQCSGIYGSTISAIGSAFGVSVAEWLPFLDYFTLLLVLVSVMVLYYAKKDLMYKPFLISVFAGILIFADTLYFQMRYPIYVGNVLMIAGALWNSKLNKANLMPFPIRKKKQAVNP